MKEVIKDMEKAERLKEAYRHLFAHHGISTQKDLAICLKVQRTALSAAFNGNTAYLTKNLFMKLCAAFPGVFNLDYLLTGSGTLLTIEEEAKSSETEKAASASTDAPAAVQLENMLELYARMIRGVDDLRVQLQSELAEVRSIKSDFIQAREDLRDITYRLTHALSRLNEYHSPSAYPLIAADESIIASNPNVSPQT